MRLQVDHSTDYPPWVDAEFCGQSLLVLTMA